jgi:GT2 family glycosyltransferase
MVYFVVVTFNSVQFIENCIVSILTYEPNASIIVVDNNSKDDTIAIVKNFKDIHLIRNQSNLGFGKANNIGIEYALSKGAEYLYLINHDAYLIESVTRKAIDIFNHNPEYGILTPFQVQVNKNELEINFARFLSWDGALTQLINDSFLTGKEKEVYELPFAQAASWIIKKEAILKVGLFNPLFFHYGEDNEYLNRLKYHGYKLGLMSKSRMVHIANPLNINYKKNFDKYHRNREFNKWLISQLDLNSDFTLKSWIKSLFPYINKFFFSVFKLNLLRGFKLMLLLVRIMKVSSHINSSRLNNSKIFIP